MRVSTLFILCALVAGGVVFAWKQGWLVSAQEKAVKSFTLHYSEGQSLYLTERYADAIREFQAALDLDPKNSEAPTALARIGDCYKAQKEYAKAIETYDRVVNEYPDYKMRQMVMQARDKLKGLY